MASVNTNQRLLFNLMLIQIDERNGRFYQFFSCDPTLDYVGNMVPPKLLVYKIACRDNVSDFKQYVYNTIHITIKVVVIMRVLTQSSLPV